MGFGMLRGTTGDHMSLLPEIREAVPLGGWVLVSQFSEECWHLSNLPKSSYSQDWTHF